MSKCRKSLRVALGLGLAAAVAGCSQPNAEGDAGGGAPHSLGQAWFVATASQATGGTPAFHGDAYAARPAECQSCHGGSAGITAFCSQCHFGPEGSRVPAGSAWVHGSVPHTGMAAQDAVCSACHTLLRQFQAGPAGCHDCHVAGGGGPGPGATHPTGQAWNDPNSATFHGAQAATAQAREACKACHGADLAGGSTGVSCFSCHFDPTGARVPTGAAWVHGTVPHTALGAQEAVCNACHTLLRQYQAGPAGCHDCHVAPGGGTGGGGSHATGRAWMDKTLATFHGAQAGTAQAQEACKTCHGADLRGGSVGVSCFSCHFSANGSRVPPGSTWVHGMSGHTSRGSVRAVCQACHDTNDAYGNGPSCHNCH